MAEQLTPLSGEDYARHFAASGSYFDLMRLKRALSALPQDQANAAFRRLLPALASCGMENKPLISLREAAYASATPAFETLPGGAPFELKPARTLGAGNHYPLTGTARALFVACLHDATVRGGSAIVEVGGKAILDADAAELARLDDQLDFDPSIFRASGAGVTVLTPLQEPAPVDIPEAFMLTGPHTIAFGHWMWEYLPKFVAAVCSGYLPSVPALIDRSMPKTHRQSLELLFPGTELIELGSMVTARVARLWCAPALMHMPLLEHMNERFRWDYLASPAERFAPLIHDMQERADRAIAAPGRREKLFLGRRSFRHRKLVNREAVEASAMAQGFSVVYPEDLSFAEQVRLLRGARFVVGPEGSALFLCFFAKPGTRVLFLNHRHTAGLPLITSLLEAIGLNVTVMTGPSLASHPEYPHFDDYEIDSLAFHRFLESWV